MPINGSCPTGYHKRDGYKSNTGKYIRSRCVLSQTPYKKSQSRRMHNVGRKLTCKKGYIVRKGYVRRYTTALRKRGFTRVRNGVKTKVFPSSKSTYVKAACIKDTGLPGSIPEDEKIGPLRKGELIKHGYQFRLPIEKRHEALKSAIKEFGALNTFRKLDAVAKLSVRTSPTASKVFAMDRDWVKTKF